MLELDYLVGYLNGLKINSENQYKLLAKENSSLNWKNNLLFALQIGGSSNAEKLKENIDRTDARENRLSTKFDKTISEMEKWLITYPELGNLIDWDLQ